MSDHRTERRPKGRFAQKALRALGISARDFRALNAGIRRKSYIGKLADQALRDE